MPIVEIGEPLLMIQHQARQRKQPQEKQKIEAEVVVELSIPDLQRCYQPWRIAKMSPKNVTPPTDSSARPILRSALIAHHR